MDDLTSDLTAEQLLKNFNDNLVRRTADAPVHAPLLTGVLEQSEACSEKILHKLVDDPAEAGAVPAESSVGAATPRYDDTVLNADAAGSSDDAAVLSADATGSGDDAATPGDGAAVLNVDAVGSGDDAAVLNADAAGSGDDAATPGDGAAKLSVDAAVLSVDAAVLSDDAAVLSDDAAVLSDDAAVLSDDAAELSDDAATTNIVSSEKLHDALQIPLNNNSPKQESPVKLKKRKSGEGTSQQDDCTDSKKPNLSAE